MPRDMAIIGPRAWIICLELNNEMAASAQHVHVAAGGIGEDVGVKDAVEWAGAFGEDSL